MQIVRFGSGKTSLKCYIASNEKPLLVMGNGPSLKELFLDNHINLLNYEICVVNDFALSETYEFLKPKYYVISDDLYWMDYGASNCLMWDRNKLFDILINKTDWELLFFIPSEIFKKNFFQKIFLNNSNIKVIPFNKYPFRGFNRIKYFLYRRNLSMPQIQNVLVAALFIGLNLEYKKLFLLGAENDWTKFIRVNDHNEVCTVNNHFYKTESMQLTPWNKGTGENYKMMEILTDLSKMFAGYAEINKYAKIKRAKIVNSTKNSLIDSFARKPIY